MPAPEMRADPRKDHPDLVLRVALDRQAVNHHEPTSFLDLATDLLDDGPQRRNVEMLAPQIVEAEAGRLCNRIIICPAS